MFVPERRVFANYAFTKLFVAVFGLLFLITPLCDPLDSVAALSRQLRVPNVLSMSAFGVGVIVLFLVLLVVDARRVPALERRGIWVAGVFLLPDALVVRRRTVQVFRKRDIVRFAYVSRAGNAGVLETCCVTRTSAGAQETRPIFTFDVAARLEQWRAA
jgi:hypothetical protein